MRTITEIAKQVAAYYVAHREEIRKRQAEYSAVHREELSKKAAEYYATHRAEQAWRNMHQRAQNKDGHSPSYANVKVCARWHKDNPKGKANFVKDMGQPPKGTTLSRFGDIGNYKPSNCAWHTRAQQAAEHSRSRHPNLNNTSGYKGVFWQKQNHKWWSKIEVDGVYKYLGCFVFKEDARDAYYAAALQLHKHMAQEAA